MCCKSEISQAMLLFVCHDRLLLLATQKGVMERGQFKHSKAWALLGLQCLLDLFVLVACQETSPFVFADALQFKKFCKICIRHALTHLAPDQPLPFLYEIPCKGK